MRVIVVECENCGLKHGVNRTVEIPDDVTSLLCNWCPECEDDATDYYNEKYVYTPIVEPIDPNQLNLF